MPAFRSTVPQSTVTSDKEVDPVASEPSPSSNSKGSRFWLCFLAILVSVFLSALDFSAMPTALPTITAELHGGDNFVWVGSGYGLASAAFLLLAGTLADIMGRKPVLLASIALFSVGSALAGASQNMNMLIAARVIQGVGGGPILTLAQIVISDLVPLAERGAYQGMLVLVWAIAGSLGSVIGGALAKVSWRWIFYLNLPLDGIAFVLVLVFLRVRSPEGSVRQKLSRVDWFGNVLVATGSTLALIGLTWGGVQYPWASAHVLAPLILGFALMACFFAYEFWIPAEPTLPFDVLSNRTSFCGFFSAFIHGITSISAIFYVPTYAQACLGASSLRSSVDTLPIALVVPAFAMLSGLAIKSMNKYRPVIVIGWVLSTVGFGVLSLLKADSSVGAWVGFQIVVAVGTGFVYTSTVFPILAPLSVSRNAAALAFFTFCRAFAQTWGVAISGAILQNQLKDKLPPAFTAQFPSGVQIAYAVIPTIGDLEPALRTTVRNAFADSLSVIWKTMAGLCGVAILSLVLLKEVPMVKHTDEKYGLEEASAAKAPVTDTEIVLTPKVEP